jgi:hypothetical protein
LLPDERAGVRFSRPIAPAAAAARVAVVDEAGSTVPFSLEVETGTTLVVETNARAFRVQVDDTTSARRFRVASADELGGIAGRVVDNHGGIAVIDVSLEGGVRRLERTVRADADGAFALSGLPAGSYRVRVHIDMDGGARWDGGSLFPYVAPEPVGWLPGPVRVRARWVTDLGNVRLDGGIAMADGIDADQQQGR